VHNEFTAIVERDGEWFISYCAEVPGANRQGHTRAACIANLQEAITLVLEDKRDVARQRMAPPHEATMEHRRQHH
jgi:predicted RNase H-like HicB family nuclease